MSSEYPLPAFVSSTGDGGGMGVWGHLSPGSDPTASSLPLGGESEGNMSAVLGVGKCVVISLLQDRGLEVAEGSQIYSIGDPELFFWRKIAGSNSGQTVTGKKA